MCRMGLSPYFGRFWGIYDWVNFLLFFISYGFRYRALALAVAVKFPPDQGVFVNYESPAFAITQWKNIMVRKNNSGTFASIYHACLPGIHLPR